MPKLCPDDGVQAQEPEHVMFAVPDGVGAGVVGAGVVGAGVVGAVLQWYMTFL